MTRLGVCLGMLAFTSCGAPHDHPIAPAETWIHRRLIVGNARVEATLGELRLVIDGDRATLIVSEKRAVQAGFDGKPAALPFHEVRRTTLLGTARRSNDALDIAFLPETGARTLHCTMQRRRVALASALRVRDPSFDSECGNRGVWMPPDMIETSALVCAFDTRIGADTREIAFGRAPGIELLGISEDCFMQGEAERLVPDDGSLAPALSSPQR